VELLSVHIEAPLGEPGVGTPLLGTHERLVKEGFVNGASLSLYTLHAGKLEEEPRETHVI
jgi:hypothetical protein